MIRTTENAQVGHGVQIVQSPGKPLALANALNLTRTACGGGWVNDLFDDVVKRALETVQDAR
jgi:hypothetical protein